MENLAVNKFLHLVKSDKALESELRTAMLSASSPTAALNKAVDLAQVRGFGMTAEELRTQLPSISVPPASMSGALNDAELSSISGGVFNWAKACTGSDSVYCYICAMGTTG